MAGAPLLISELPVKVGDVERVMPSAPTDCSPLYLSFIDRVEDYPINFLYFYPAAVVGSPANRSRGGGGGGGGDGDVATTLRQALSDVLVPYYFMAGRLSPNKEFIDCNRAGALFAAASSPLSIAELGDVTYPNPEFAKLVLRLGAHAATLNDQPVLTIQVTKFSCGGWSLGVSTRHAALDGIATCEFFMNYASLARGETLVVEPKPDRGNLKPRDPPQIKYGHLEYVKASDIQSSPSQIDFNAAPTHIFKIFPFTTDMLNRIKALAVSDSFVDKCSTFEAMTAHVWRVRTKAINMPSLAPSIVNFAVDFRSRIKPPLPKGFAGNAILSGYANALAEELCKKTLSFAVQKVQEAKNVVDDEFIRSSIDFGTLNGATLNLKDGFLLTTLCSIPFDSIDFGWGKPIYAGPIIDDKVELVTFLSNGTQEGLNLFLALQPSHMIEFEKFIYNF